MSDPNQRSALIQCRIDEGDYEGALLLYDGNSRMAVLWDWLVEGEIEVEDLRALLPLAWTHAEAPSALPDLALELFRHAGFVSDTDVELSGLLTVYRGAAPGEPKEQVGISWTLSYTRAEWFARRLVRGGGGKVFVAQVQAVDVLAYFVKRDEAEVVVDPATLGGVEELPAAR